jgi:acetyl esterase/lipase
MRSGDRVALGYCDPGEVDGAFCADLFRLAGARPARLGSLLRVVGTGLLSRSRNELVATFLDRTDSAWLLMIDTDQRLPVEAFDRLVAAAHDLARPVVAGLVFAAYGSGGLYPMPVPAIFRRGPEGLLPVDDFPPDRVIPVDAHGAGCVLVHRGALQSLRDAAPAHLRDWCWFQDGPGDDGRWLSEDLTFCARLQAAGVPLHAHTGAVLPHHKDFWMTDAHHEQWRATHG